MEQRFVCYSTSSEEDLTEPLTFSNEVQKSSVSPHIGDHRKDSSEDISLEIIDQWDPTVDNIIAKSNPDDISEIESPFQDGEQTTDENQMVGYGRKDRVTFSDGECQRQFHNAVYVKTFLPNETSVCFLSILEAVQKILEVDFLQILKE